MREILFRGLRTDGKGWVEGDLNQNYIHHKSGATIVQNGCICYEVLPETVGQFTGLLDKNGVKIFEGDKCDGHGDGFGVITWSKFDGGYEYVFEDEAAVGIWEVIGDAIVIGNIHEK